MRAKSPSSPVISPIDISTPKKTTYGADQPNRADPKLGKNNISFVRDRDIWLTDFEGNETQLTFCASQGDSTLKCGVAEYMMQEEFHRFTGYYRRPTSQNHILYLETTEKDVEQISISKSTSLDTIRYPCAGKPNAKSCLKIVEFDHGIVHKQLWGVNDIQTQFPWMEYIVRFGWLPDGQR